MSKIGGLTSYFFLMGFVLVTVLTGSRAFALNQVIYISPERGYIIASQGSDNGFKKNQDVCFDDPRQGRITCGRVYVARPTASGFVLLSKYADKISLQTIVSPLRWRVNDRSYNKEPLDEDVDWIKKKLAHLDRPIIPSPERQPIVQNPIINPQVYTEGATERSIKSKRPLRSLRPVGVRPKQAKKNRKLEQDRKKNPINEAERAQKIKVNPMPSNTSTSDTKAIKSQTVETTAEDKQSTVQDQPKITQKINPETVVLTKFLSWPVSLGIDYTYAFTLPTKHNRVIFESQFSGADTYWKEVNNDNQSAAGVRFNLRQDLTQKWFYGLDISFYPPLVTRSLNIYDNRRTDLIASVDSELTIDDYGIKLGYVFLNQPYFTLDYSTGITLFSHKRILFSQFSSRTENTNATILARASRSSLIIASAHEIRAKLHLNGIGVTLKIGGSLNAIETNQSIDISTSDPNFSDTDESSASKDELTSIFNEQKNLLSYYVAVGLDYSI